MIGRSTAKGSGFYSAYRALVQLRSGAARADVCTDRIMHAPLEHEAGPPAAIVPEVPGYELGDELGSGGSGVVYQAVCLATGEAVAVKVLSKVRFADERAVRRFLREVRLQAGLRHPAILALHDAGFTETDPYLVTELARGGSLRQFLALHREPALETVWRLGARIARGLEFAHARGVVHRDLKPGNILLDEDGEPKIADFGFAKALSSEHSFVTTAGILVGTPSYIAPEAVEGLTTGAPADVYALGTVLFELLTGVLPFTGVDLMELLAEKLAGEFPPLGLLRPDVPRGGRDVVEACLARSPRRRPTAARAAQSLEELAKAQAREAGPSAGSRGSTRGG